MSLPDIHAETAAESDLMTVAHILSTHRGSEQAVTSQEIADLTGLDSLDSTPRTRGVIRRLSEEHGFPIGASSNGYFLIADGDEADEYLETLNTRIQGIVKRKQTVQNAIEQRGYAKSAAEVSNWLDDVEEQAENDVEERQ